MKKPKTFKRRLMQVILLLIPVAGGAWWLWHHYAPIAVQVVSPERGLAVEAVYANGLVEAQQTAKVSPVSGGQIVELRAEIGDRVEPGQIWAVMNTRQAQQRLQEAQAVYKLALKE